jgi:branched-chain amino acid transport system ATP-binding protein
VTETAAPVQAAGETDVLFAVEHVTLRFGGVTSLNDVSLEQRRGEILAVIGPNGAGKTSLFNCLSGVYVPQEGTITFHPRNGEPRSVVGVKPYKVNRMGVSRTFQTSRMFNAMTTFENVKIGVESKQHTGPIGAMLRLPRTRHEEHVGDIRTLQLLKFVDLEHRVNDISSSLPYGERRRLEIARALGTNPEVLLLDEPAAGTNPSEKLALANLIKRVNSELGVTILLIEHDMKLVMSVAERIVVLNFGQVIAEGSPAEIQQNPVVVNAYLGTSGDEGTPGVPAEAEAEAETTAPEAGPAADSEHDGGTEPGAEG